MKCYKVAGEKLRLMWQHHTRQYQAMTYGIVNEECIAYIAVSNGIQFVNFKGEIISHILFTWQEKFRSIALGTGCLTLSAGKEVRVYKQVNANDISFSCYTDRMEKSPERERNVII